MKKVKKIPSFKTESEEQAFWDKKSPLDYADHFKKIRLDEIVDLSPKYISIRLSPKMIAELKNIANEMDVAYQALIKMWLSERIKKEKSHIQITDV